MSEYIITKEQLIRFFHCQTDECDEIAASLPRITRCRDCDFGKDYEPDLSYRDCSMMRHKIVPENNFCGLAKPKGFCARMIEPKEEA